MPKTAGTACLNLFERVYRDRLLRDYDDKVLSNSIFSQRKHAVGSMTRNLVRSSSYMDFDCIHGHFMPLKYRFLPTTDTFYMTWLRHPVQRLISHYHYWFRQPLDERGGALRQRVVGERWSLNRFCMSEELRDIYTRILWGFPLKKFNFIGVTEFFEEDLRCFTKAMFGSSLEIEVANLNPERREDLYSIDQDLQREIEIFHKRDMVLYNEALELRLTH